MKLNRWEFLIQFVADIGKLRRDKVWLIIGQVFNDFNGNNPHVYD